MRLINIVLGAFAALLAAAALAAIWSLAGLVGAGRATWLAPIVALVLVAILRFNNHPPGISRALFGASLVLLTCAYANYLMAAGFIAGQMGLGLFDTLQLIGPDMAFAVSQAHTDRIDLLWYACALLVGLAFGFRQPGELRRK